MASNKNSMVFYESFLDAVNDIPDEDLRNKMIYAIIRYGLFKEEPEGLIYPLTMAWKLIKPNLDANMEKRENGRKGGAPKGNKNNHSGNNQHDVKSGQPQDNHRTTTGQPMVKQRTTNGYPSRTTNVDVDGDADVDRDVYGDADANADVDVDVDEEYKASPSSSETCAQYEWEDA